MTRRIARKCLTPVLILVMIIPALTVPIYRALAFHTGSLTNGIPTVLTLVAAGSKSQLSTFTTGNNTTLSNGTYWYWRDKSTFGFSPNATVNIDATKGYDICASSFDASCSTGTGSSRLSWKMSSTNVIPGGRIGSRTDITTGDAVRMCFTASTQPSYYPSGIQRNVLVSTITSGGWAKSAESYFRATSYPDPTMVWCLGNGSTYANYFLVGSFDPSATNVLSFSPRSSTSNNGAITYDLQFTEAVSGLTASDFTVSGTGAGSCVVSNPVGGSANYVVSLSGCSAGNVTLTLNSNAVTGSTTGPTVAESAATVTVIEIATTISLALDSPGALIYKGLPVGLSATVSQSGIVTFYANGKRIAGCVAVASTSTTATCLWKPSTQGPVVLSALLKPSNASYTRSSSLNIVVGAQKRNTFR